MDGRTERQLPAPAAEYQAPTSMPAFTMCSVPRVNKEIEIEPGALELDPENVRSEPESSVVEGLREALRTSGDYINAPVVYKTDAGSYRVHHGSTRVIAARGVVDRLRVRVTDPPPTPRTKVLSQLSENLLQSGLGPVDIGNALRQLRDSGNMSIGQLVGALKASGVIRSRAWVLRHLALTELDEDVQRAVARGELQVTNALQLRRFAPEEQRAWCRRIIEEGIGLQSLEGLLSHEGGANTDDPFLESPEQRVPRMFEIEAEMRERLSDVAETNAQARPGHGIRPREQRDGPVRTRWEFLPALLQIQEKPGRKGRSKLASLKRVAWYESATELQRRLVEELLLLGTDTPQEAISLVEEALGEQEAAWEPIMVTLHGLRILAENPERLARNSALATFLKLRMRRVLGTLV